MTITKSVLPEVGFLDFTDGIYLRSDSALEIVAVRTLRGEGTS